MKKFGVFLLLAFFPVFSAQAYNGRVEPNAVVEKLRGKVLLNQDILSEGEKLFAGGKLVTNEKSFVVLRVPSWGSSVTVGPNSAMDVNFERDSDSNYTLKSGICRWISEMGKAHSGEQVKTKTAAFGVRGTDFMAKYAPTGETEIIVLDGKVNFRSALVKSGTENGERMISKGQWGGVGGKFGKTIEKVVDAPAEAIRQWKTQVE